MFDFSDSRRPLINFDEWLFLFFNFFTLWYKTLLPVQTIVSFNDANNPLVSIILISKIVNMSSNTYSNTVRPVQQIIAQLSYMKNNATQIITVDKNKYTQ